MLLARERGVSVGGEPATYFGNTIQAGFAGSATRARCGVGTFMWLTAPLAVSCVTALNVALGSKAPITDSDWFFRLTGRHSGVIDRSAGEISVNSSDNRRQPRLIKPAHKVLLPDPGGAGRIAARPSRSITAACRIRYWCACEEMHQFIAHSRNGIAWPTGSGSNGDAPS